MAKVLIVDDSSLGRKLLKRVLISTNHQVVAEAENGEQGIIEYRRIKPDIVTMDVDMPGISGLEAGKRIIQEHPDAKVVVVSAHEQNDLKDEMSKYGLEYCIIKPVTDEKVRESFGKALSSVNNNLNAVIQENKEVNPPDVKAPVINVSVTHHSAINNIVAVKKGQKDNVLLLAFRKETSINNFMEEDPIVVGYESDDTCFISQCELSYVDTTNKIIKAEIIKSYPLESDDLNQYLPTSMYIDLKVIGTIKRFPAIISSFTVNEIVIKSIIDFENNEKLSFDIFDDNKLISIEGTIISKTFRRKYTEYILKLDFDDYNRKKLYVAYLQEQTNLTRNSIKALFATV